MPKLPNLKAVEILKAAKRLGFYLDHQKGSHATLQHSQSGRSVTVPIHPGKTIGKGLMHQIIHDLEVNNEEFLKALKKKK